MYNFLTAKERRLHMYHVHTAKKFQHRCWCMDQSWWTSLEHRSLSELFRYCLQRCLYRHHWSLLQLPECTSCSVAAYHSHEHCSSLPQSYLASNQWQCQLFVSGETGRGQDVKKERFFTPYPNSCLTHVTFRHSSSTLHGAKSTKANHLVSSLNPFSLISSFSS